MNTRTLSSLLSLSFQRHNKEENQNLQITPNLTISLLEIKQISPLNSFSKEIELELKFRIIKASYREEKQYIIYDFNSFFGDVGGILGLLLGYSVLSLYGDIARVLGRFKRSLPK